MSELLRQYVYTFLARVGAALGLLLLNIAVARVLSVDAFGQFSFGLVLLLGLSVIVRFGHDNSIMKLGGIFLGEGKTGCFRTLVYRSIVFAIVLSGFVSFGIGILSGYVPDAYLGYVDVLKAVSWALPPFSLTFFIAASIRARGRPELAPLFEVGGAGLLMAMAVAILGAASIVGDAASAILVLAVTCLLITAGGFIFLATTVRNQGRPAALRDCLPEKASSLNLDFFVMALAGYLVQWFAPLVISVFSSAKSLGLYSAAHGLAMAMGFVLYVFNGVLSPKIASAYFKGDLDGLERMFMESTRIIMLIVVPLSLILLVFPEFVLRLYGEEYVRASGILRLLVLAQLINVSVGSVGLVLGMTGHENYMRNITIASAMLGVILGLSLVPVYAEWGAAVSVFVSIAFQNITAAYVVYKRFGIISYGWQWARRFV